MKYCYSWFQGYGSNLISYQSRIIRTIRSHLLYTDSLMFLISTSFDSSFLSPNHLSFLLLDLLFFYHNLPILDSYPYFHPKLTILSILPNLLYDLLSNITDFIECRLLYTTFEENSQFYPFLAKKCVW